MRFGSLFSGIGGLDLGLERAGMTCSWQVEIDEYARRVLTKHWPDVPKFPDVRRIDGRELSGVDLVCGGFPCQPVSVAGKRRAQEDERWLWPEFARILRLVRPRYVLVENVPGLLARGMGDVLGELSALGYDAEWESLPAVAFGALHRRDRVFLVAYTQHGRDSFRARLGQQERERQEVGRGEQPLSYGSDGIVADSERGRRGESAAYPVTPQRALCEAKREEGAFGFGSSRENVAHAHTSGRDGRTRIFRSDGWGEPTNGGQWESEPNVGRVAHGVPRRVDRLRGLGNAVVPQVAEWIGRRILEFDQSEAA